jgi:hypothetical protein
MYDDVPGTLLRLAHTACGQGTAAQLKTAALPYLPDHMKTHLPTMMDYILGQ